MTTGVYLIHFDPAYKHARHYLGYADDIHLRVCTHLRGQGARLTQVAKDAGSNMILVRIWEDATRTVERKLKNRKATPCLCPICRGEVVQMPLMPWIPAYVPQPKAEQEDQPDDTRDDQPEYTERFEDLAMTDDYADDQLDREFWRQGAL